MLDKCSEIAEVIFLEFNVKNLIALSLVIRT